MDKRVSSRGIIIEDGSVYAMFRRRIKDDGTVKEYYVIPGGGIEENETLEQTVTIHAEFPNATNHSEIEEAFNNLVNKASQYANRK